MPVNHTPETFPDDRQLVTFVGRPFSLEEAHDHFSHLRRRGLAFLRFLVTWEAIEHNGLCVHSLLFKPTYQLNKTVAGTTIHI
ncbi:hypothetical protein F5887DRAFT_132385 [Amanita rubescens]|nr:hypothetical protein F5887DRAFT_132385 [Amanita rubescens]